jgi:hypothetical protein
MQQHGIAAHYAKRAFHAALLQRAWYRTALRSTEGARSPHGVARVAERRRRLFL